MKNLLCSACAVLLFASAAHPCFAADSAWNGTWKLDQAKSNLTGGTFSITLKDDGSFVYSNESNISYNFACNGNAYPTIADRTVTCTGSRAEGYNFTVKAGSTVLSQSNRVLSPNGNTMTIQGTNMYPDGTTEKFMDVYKRVGETSGNRHTVGMDAKWKDVKSQESRPGTMVLAVNGNMIHIKYPDSKETVSGKLDGSDSPVSGPTIPAGVSEALKADSPDKLHYAIKYKSKTLDEGTEALSDGGKVLTVEEWAPGKTAEKQTLVFVKQ